MELPPYAALVNQKLVLPSSSSRYFAVEQHFFHDCMNRTLAGVQVDEEFYLDTYPDVRDAVEQGTVGSAREHYTRFGYFEHRMPYRIEVDEDFYLDTYPDVRDAIARAHFASGQEHFEAVGYREGRLPHPGFRLIGGGYE